MSNELCVTLSTFEVETVKRLIEDWGWDYALKADRRQVVALARRLGLEKLAQDLMV